MGKKLWLTIGILVLVPLFSVGQESSDGLLIQIDGRTRVVITDPNGDRVGSHGFDVWQENTNAELQLGFDNQSISYSNLIEGEYQLGFRGQHNEQFNVTVAVIDAGRYRDATFTRWANAQTTSHMTLTLSRDKKGSIMLNSPELAHPLGYATKTPHDMTSLHWTEVAGATKYTIYSKFWDYPYYKPLGQTTSTSFETNVVWATNSGNPLKPQGVYYFVVVAHFGNNNTSVFSPIVTNDDMDNDGFNDYQEIALGTDPVTLDTDDDGLNDFEEINRYYSDPLKQDTDGDGHPDGDEVERGTLPNRSESYPGRREECDAPTSGDWHVTAHCDVVRNQEVSENIVVHPNAVMNVQNNVTIMFDYVHHHILVMFGGGIQLNPGAQIKQK